MKKLLFCAAMMLLSGLQALPVNAAAAAQPFVRWSVYSAAAGNENALRAAVATLNTALQNSEGVLAVYGGEDENGVMRYLEIYTDENAFNAAQNNANVKTAAAQALKLAQVHKTLAADAFNLQSKTAGTADKARMALLVIDPAQLDAYKKSACQRNAKRRCKRRRRTGTACNNRNRTPQRIPPAGAVCQRQRLPRPH